MVRHEIFPSAAREREVQPQGLSYKTFKTVPPEELQGGNVRVNHLSPSKLWASQDWISPEKVLKTSLQPVIEEKLVLPAYYKDMPATGQRAIILANGHHHALRVSEQGGKVNVAIIGELPEGKDFISFSRYRRGSGIVFRDI